MRLCIARESLIFSMSIHIYVQKYICIDVYTSGQIMRESRGAVGFVGNIYIYTDICIYVWFVISYLSFFA